VNYGFFFGGESIELLLQNLFVVIGDGVAVIVCDDWWPVVWVGG
jgi:hypothetical protein